MVMVEFPGAAEPLTLRLTVLVSAPVRVTDAVTPAGNCDTVTVTVPLNPFCGVAVTVAVPDALGATVRADGCAASVNAGAPATVSVNRMLLVSVPETPLMVTVAVPVAAEPLAEIVSVLADCALAGLNEAVTPAGRPDADRSTEPLNPFCGLVVIVVAALAPAVTDSAAGDALSVKPGVFETPVRSSIRLWPAGVPQPVVRS